MKIYFSLSPVVFLLHQMVARSECHQVSVVRRRRYGDATGTAYVCVTQLVGEHLKLIGIEPVVIPEYVIVRGSTCTLYI